MTITIEQLEALAAQMETEDAAERARLHRLIKAYARILFIREPHHFAAKPLERSDEDGHWNNSYPPTIELKNHNGPRLVRIESWQTEDAATSGGYYHTYRTVTTDPGLYVARDGALYGANETGTGEIGQYAAYPGACNVETEIEWNTLALADVPLALLQAAEKTMRGLAFPLTQAPGKG